MSRFRDRCGELRARVLVAGSLSAVSARRDMPANDNLRSHVVGECSCGADLPPLEYRGSGAGGHWQYSDAPPCTVCETDLLVERLGSQDHTAVKCHNCGGQVDHIVHARRWLRAHGVDPDAEREEVTA